MTQAQILFAGFDIITKRPEGMPYNDYKELRRTQCKLIKRITRPKPNSRKRSPIPFNNGYNSHSLETRMRSLLFNRKTD